MTMRLEKAWGVEAPVRWVQFVKAFYIGGTESSEISIATKQTGEAAPQTEASI